MAYAHAELRADLDALVDASTDALARLRAGDEAGVLDLVERRERVLAALAGSSPEMDDAVSEAARRAVALDGELVAALRAELTGMEREFGDVMRTRRSLISYGAKPPGSPIFVERLG
jgi:hypothetical protein